MMLFVVALAAGVALRWMRLATFAPLKLRWNPLLGVALIVQLFVLPRLDADARPAVLGATLLGAAAWLFGNIVAARSNSLRVALLGVALGAAMNAIPMVQFGSMPVERAALYAVGHQESDNTGERGAKHLIVDNAPFLGDRFALRPFGAVVSLGDFVELAALALLISCVPKREHRSTAKGLNALEPNEAV
jgi:Family of unknown function (DUF5317)